MSQDQDMLTALRGEVPQIRSMLDALREEEGICGLSAAAVCGREVVLAEGFGQADSERGVPATADTIYPVGSITKIFTATMLVQLRDGGVVSLDDPIADYLPALRRTYVFPGERPATFRQAASHTTGWQRDPIIWVDGAAPLLTEQGMLDRLAQAQPSLPPMSRIKYSNVAVACMGLALARAAGETYADYVAAHILGPLGMANSSIGEPGEPMAQLAVGRVPSTHGGEPVTVRSLPDPGPLAPAGGLYSTAADLARFVMLQFGEGPAGGKQVLCGTSLREMRAPVFLRPDWQSGYGIGWELSRFRDQLLVSHGGARHGYMSHIAFLPARRLGVVVLIADGRAKARQTSERVLKAMLLVADPIAEEWEGKDSHPAELFDASMLAVYEGRYAMEGIPPIDVAVEDGRLIARSQAFGSCELSPLGENRFVGNGGSIMDQELVDFVIGEDGCAATIIVGNGSFLFHRASCQGPT